MHDARVTESSADSAKAVAYTVLSSFLNLVKWYMTRWHPMWLRSLFTTTARCVSADVRSVRLFMSCPILPSLMNKNLRFLNSLVTLSQHGGSDPIAFQAEWSMAMDLVQITITTTSQHTSVWWRSRSNEASRTALSTNSRFPLAVPWFPVHDSQQTESVTKSNAEANTHYKCAWLL